MMRERWQLEQYDQAKKQIGVATKVVNTLVNLPGMSVDEIGLAQAAVAQTLPVMPTITPDLKLSVEEIDVAVNQLRLAERGGLMESELYEKLRMALNAQREISVDRPLTFRQKLSAGLAFNQSRGNLGIEEKLLLTFSFGSSSSFAVFAGISLVNADMYRATLAGVSSLFLLVVGGLIYKKNSGKS